MTTIDPHIKSITKRRSIMQKRKIVYLLLAAICMIISQSIAVEHSVDTKAKRLATRSPWFYMSEDDIDLQASYSGFDPKSNSRFSHLNIGDKALTMIEAADKTIVASAFLFDVLYSEAPPERDIVGELTTALVKKKKQEPDITIAIILDPVNKGYGKRISPAVKVLVDNGADVFYSDLMSTKSATRLGVVEAFHDGLRLVDKLVLGTLTSSLSLVAGQRVPIKNPLDEKGLSVETVFNAMALKANHRKLLVTDIGSEYEAMISSANPHNASIPSTNFSVSIKGEIAKYVYMTIREDIMASMKLGDCLWSDKSKKYREDYLRKRLRPLPINSAASTSQNISACFITEIRIREQIISMLNSVKPDDEVRIQMFYLSEPDVVEAIVRAARRVKKPMRIILDPSKDAFGKEKDGTPNRQVAAYLMEKKKEFDLNLKIRWYETHGEQNHAKIMTIVNANAASPRYELMTGSANWTGKNLNDINLEANIAVKGSKKITSKFNRLFDMFWGNTDGNIYTVGYRGKYEMHAGMNKWLDGEKWGYVSW